MVTMRQLFVVAKTVSVLTMLCLLNDCSYLVYFVQAVAFENDLSIGGSHRIMLENVPSGPSTQPLQPVQFKFRLDKDARDGYADSLFDDQFYENGLVLNTTETMGYVRTFVTFHPK